MRVPAMVSAGGLLFFAITGSAGDKPKPDQEALQGTWEVVEQAPKAVPNVVYERLVFKGDKITFHSQFEGQKDSVECEFRLNPAGRPKAIDFRPINELGADAKPYLGLYELKDGRLRICYRGPGSTRPADFDDKQEKGKADSTVFITLKYRPDV